MDLDEVQVAILAVAEVSHWPFEAFVTVWTI
jgi:hypothetical protein